MKNRIFSRLALLLVPCLLSGCAVLPFLPFVAAMGSAYEGYVVWKSGTATKYYAFDPDTTYRAVMQASDRLQLEITLIKSTPKGGYTLETKKNIHMHIDILPLEESVSVTTVVIKIPILGDKQYAELFYRLVDDNLKKKADVCKEKTQ